MHVDFSEPIIVYCDCHNLSLFTRAYSFYSTKKSWHFKSLTCVILQSRSDTYSPARIFLLRYDFRVALEDEKHKYRNSNGGP